MQKGIYNAEMMVGGKNEFEIKSCCICVDEFKIGDKIRITFCRHLFHAKCLMQWVKFKNEEQMRMRGVANEDIPAPDCPLCNQSLLDKPEAKDQVSESNIQLVIQPVNPQRLPVEPIQNNQPQM